MNHTKAKGFHSIISRGVLCFLLVLSMLCPATVFGTTNPFMVTATATDYTYTYYPRYYGNSGSFVEALKAVGVDSSFSNRQKIAALNGYSSYSGTAAQNTALLSKLKGGTLIKSKTAVPNGDWQISMPSSVTVEKGKSTTVTVQFMGTGIDSFNGTYTNSSAISIGFSDAVWKPAGQWCSVNIVVTGKSVGTSTVTFQLKGTRTMSKSFTVNVVNSSSSLVNSNLSKINYIKQPSSISCKSSSVAMALNVLTGKNTYTAASMGGDYCNGVKDRYVGSDGRTYIVTYKSDDYEGTLQGEKDAISTALSAGLPIVVAVHSTRSGYTRHHWIVVVGQSGNDYLVVDPASGSSGSMASNVKTMSSLKYELGLTDYSKPHYGYVSFARV